METFKVHSLAAGGVGGKGVGKRVVASGALIIDIIDFSR